MSDHWRSWAIVLALLILASAGCSRVGAGGGAGDAATSPVPTSYDPHVDTAGPLGTPAPDPNMPVQICGIQGVVDVAFVIPPGARYDDLVPALTGATELEGKQGSLVVLYDGPATIKYLTGIPGASRQPTQKDIVCVVTPDGEPNIYTDIGREGMIVPEGIEFTGPINDETICERFRDAPICGPV